MLNNILHLLLFVGIGSLIGGCTNMIAIRMLFRPYNPVYIANFKLPFTPGVIPSKHQQLAEKMANVITEYILTPDAITGALAKTGFQNIIKTNLMNNWKRLADNQTNIGSVLDKLQITQDAVVDYLAPIIKEQLIKANKPKFIEAKIDQLTDNFANWEIQTMLPEFINTAIRTNTENFVPIMQNHLSNHLDEPATKNALSQMIEEIIAIKNPLMRKLFMGVINDDNILDMIVEKLQQIIVSDALQVHFHNYIQTELDKLMSSTLNDLESKYPVEYIRLNDFINKSLHKLIQQSLHSEQFENSLREELTKIIAAIYNTKLKTVYKKANPYITNVVDWSVDKSITYLEQHIDQILTHININTIIQEQIVSFDPATLEKLIIQVAKRELQYITLLGFLLGGIIGFIQYFIANTQLL